jgi:hypothetical protein
MHISNAMKLRAQRPVPCSGSLVTRREFSLAVLAGLNCRLAPSLISGSTLPIRLASMYCCCIQHKETGLDYCCSSVAWECQGCSWGKDVNHCDPHYSNPIHSSSETPSSCCRISARVSPPAGIRRLVAPSEPPAIDSCAFESSLLSLAWPSR